MKTYKKFNSETVRVSWNKSGNVKIGAMWSFSTLFGNDIFYIPECEDMQYISGTCGKHCTGCKSKCYVRKSYRHSSVKYGHAKNTVAFRRDPMQAARELSGYIERAKNKPSICRFDQSGEIENAQQFAAFCWLARQHKDITFYVYSKAFDIIVPLILSDIVPENMTVLISIWHEYGIAEYMTLKDRDNIKAFVYDDRKFNYSAAGLEIQTYCHAYDENGKLNHDITCDKCQKCFNRLMSCKVIGCYDH